MGDLVDRWVGEHCTLPTAERPMRLAEFDDLFGSAVTASERVDATRLRLELRPDAAGRAADLAARETRCCSFFAFTLELTGGRVSLAVEVPPERVDVLDAVAFRARA